MKNKIIIIIIITSIFIVCSIVSIIVLNKNKGLITNIQNDSIVSQTENIITNEINQNTNEVLEDNISEGAIEDEIIEVTKEDAGIIPEDSTSSLPSASPSVKTTETISTNTKSSSKQSNTPVATTVVTPTPVQEETKVEETKPVETPVRCTNNHNHAVDVGNSGKWFSTKDDAIAYYDSLESYWGNYLENTKVNTDEEYDALWANYNKNCPSGYEVWDCMYCSKWTINFYYR